MFSKKLLVVLVAVIAVQSCNSLFPQMGYGSVNSFLESLEGSENAEEYMIELRKKLISILEGGFIARNKNPLFVAALRNIVKLAPLLNVSRCTSDELKSISDLPIGVDVQRYLSEFELIKLTRLQWLVHQVFLTRAEHCREIYPKMFEIAYSQLNSTVKEHAEFKRAEYRAISGPSERDYIEYLVDLEAHTDRIENDLDLAIKHVTNSSVVEQNLCDFKLMFKRYLKNPCLEYNKKLGDPIFNQVTKEANMFKGQTGYLLGSNLVKFYESMSFVRDCDSVDENFEFLACLHWNDNYRPNNCPVVDC